MGKRSRMRDSAVALRMILAERGIKGKAVALALNVAPSTVSGWANGEVIGDDNLTKLLEFLKMSRCQFYAYSEVWENTESGL